MSPLRLEPYSVLYEAERKRLASRVKGDILREPTLEAAAVSSRLAGLEEWWVRCGRGRWHKLRNRGRRL